MSKDMDRKTFPAFPPAARLAVVVGQPAELGAYLIRVKVPAGVKSMPHRDREDRIYTVILGVFYIGIGDEFDANKLQACPPEAVIVLPAEYSAFLRGKNPAGTSHK